MRYQDAAQPPPHHFRGAASPEQNSYELANLRTTIFGPQGDNGLYGDMRALKSDVREILDTLRAIEEINRRVEALEVARAAEEAAKKHRWKTVFDQVIRWAIGLGLSMTLFLVGFYLQNQDKINLPQ